MVALIGEASVWVLTLLAAPQAFAELPGPQQIISFGNELVQRGQFDAAVTEFHRAIHYFPNHDGLADTGRRMFSTSILLKNYAGTLDLAREFDEKNDAMGCVSRFYAGRAYYELRNYPRAREAWEGVRGACADHARSRYWSALSLLRQDRGDAAAKILDSVRNDPDVRSNVEHAEVLLRQRIERRDPVVAASLSAVMPGAGYVYARSPRTALAALMTNGLFIWGTVSSVQADNKGLAAVLALFSAGWYFGGVYGSGHSAERFNRRIETEAFRPLEID